MPLFVKTKTKLCNDSSMDPPTLNYIDIKNNYAVKK